MIVGMINEPSGPRECQSEQKWLTESQTAQRLNISAKWLQKTRSQGGGGGLRFAKFGSAVRYAVADIEDFERRCLRTSTSDDGEDI